MQSKSDLAVFLGDQWKQQLNSAGLHHLETVSAQGQFYNINFKMHAGEIQWQLKLVLEHKVKIVLHMWNNNICK